MKQQNIKRLIRDEVHRAVRYEVGRVMKRFRVIVDPGMVIDPVADTDMAPEDDAIDVPPDSDSADGLDIDSGSVAVS